MATKIEVRIVADSDVESPREWDNLGTMVCAHRRYNLGDQGGMREALDLIYKHLSDKQLNEMEFDASHVPDIEQALEATGQAIMLPLYLYDHSGITMSTGRFSCPWDSGKVGFIFVSKEKVRSEYDWKLLNKQRIEKIQNYLIGEVETYDQFLRGDVWGFEVLDEDGEVKDSCWGFFGSDPLTNGIADHLCDSAKELIRAGQYERVYGY